MNIRVIAIFVLRLLEISGAFGASSSANEHPFDGNEELPEEHDSQSQPIPLQPRTMHTTTTPVPRPNENRRNEGCFHIFMELVKLFCLPMDYHSENSDTVAWQNDVVPDNNDVVPENNYVVPRTADVIPNNDDLVKKNDIDEELEDFRHELTVRLFDPKEELPENVLKTCKAATINGTELIIPSELGGKFAEDKNNLSVKIIVINIGMKYTTTTIVGCRQLGNSLSLVRIKDNLELIGAEEEVKPISLWDREEKPSGTVRIKQNRKIYNGALISATEDKIFVETTLDVKHSVKGATVIQERQLVAMYLGDDPTNDGTIPYVRIPRSMTEGKFENDIEEV